MSTMAGSGVLTPVRLNASDRMEGVTDLLCEANLAADDLGYALDMAARCGHQLPAPGQGHTRELWATMASLCAVDLTLGRVVEPHLDALAILRQADCDVVVGPEDVWGVFAAEQPGRRLEARWGGTQWVLDGVKPWCSLADRLTHAVVTAYTSSTTRRAFAIDLRSPGVTTEPNRLWVARGLRDVVSLSITCHEVPASPVGADDWYLSRPGFAWGGIGVAACWYGGTVGLLRSMRAAAERREPDQIALMHLGTVDARLAAARSVLAEAAADVDSGVAAGRRGALIAARARAVVAEAAESTLTSVGHALGPAPLTGDPAHAARCADLQVYLRQHHAERDAAALGRLVLESAGTEP